MDRAPLTALLATTDFVILAVVLKSHLTLKIFFDFS